MAAITAAIETSKGVINLDLFADKTPLTVANFVNLVHSINPTVLSPTDGIEPSIGPICPRIILLTCLIKSSL